MTDYKDGAMSETKAQRNFNAAEVKSEVAVVSAFGRGHWMAAELSKLGIPTTLLDISKQLGNWAPEDWEGPFGLFKSDSLTATQIERLLEDDSNLLNMNGLTCWTRNGILEFKGPLTNYQIQQMGFSDKLTQDLVKGTNQSTGLSFRHSWLLDFASFYANVEHRANPSYRFLSHRAPLFSPFFVRHATRIGHQQSLRWCRDQGVVVPEQLEIIDVSMSDSKNFSAFEIKTDRPGVMKASMVIWGLTSEETAFLNPRLLQKLFLSQSQKADWMWIRYRMSMSQSHNRDALPVHFVCMEDPYLPWTHENTFVVQRTAIAEQFDVWVKIPTQHRFNSQYLVDLKAKLQGILTSRSPGLEIKSWELPQEYSYTYSELGPPRIPVWSMESVYRTPYKGFKNILFDGPETWSSYLWTDRFEKQARTISTVKNWWQKKQELKLKQNKNNLDRERDLT